MRRSSLSPFYLTTPLPPQGHIPAALAIGFAYCWGQGVAIDYPRAMAAYKIGAEAGNAASQHQTNHSNRLSEPHVVFWVNPTHP